VSGLAVERTVLAWTRTWLTVGACGLLLIRLGQLPVALAAGAAAVLAATAAGRRRTRYLHRSEVPLAAGVRAAAVTSVTATLLGATAAVLILLR
jgi:hypothetical protein